MQNDKATDEEFENVCYITTSRKRLKVFFDQNKYELLKSWDDQNKNKNIQVQKEVYINYTC